jgi:6-phosphogluconolactonase
MMNGLRAADATAWEAVPVTDLVYAGGYGDSLIIYELSGGKLEFAGSASTPDPSWLTLDHARRAVHVTNELTANTVSSFALGPDGTRLTPLSTRPTGGTLPCHLALHPAGYLLAANYGSGSVSVHPVDSAGSLGERTDLVQHNGSGPDSDRQAGPHAHEVRLDGDRVVVIDLGMDQLVGYRLDTSTGRLAPDPDPFARTRPGAGPRHAVTHPTGRWYVACELDSTISVFDPDRTTGVLHQVAAIPALSGADPASSSPDGRNYPAGIVLSADARFLYVSNRGADSVSVFEVDAASGDLTGIQDVSTGGEWPRHFIVHNGLMLVANQNSDSITALRIDPDSGRLTPLGTAAERPAPTFVLVL